VPETIKLIYHGRLPRWVGGKDLILHTIGHIGVDGALYQAMEFAGPTIADLPMDDRFTMANMAVEAGAKTGLFHVDEKTLAYIESRARRPYTIYQADPDARYARVVEYDVSGLEPQVAFPPLPSNVRPLSQVGEVPIDQVVIGSCTNGRWRDLLLAAEVLRGRRVHPYVRCIVIPGTQEIFLRAVREGLAEVFVEAGAVFSTPTCGPVDTWGCWPPGSAVSPPPTATSRGVWATRRARCIWPTQRWPPPVRCWVGSEGRTSFRCNDLQSALHLKNPMSS